eukprot:scaffold250_cov390-Prasinococcus_capsulatus_cf.AAC.3
MRRGRASHPAGSDRPGAGTGRRCAMKPQKRPREPQTDPFGVLLGRGERPPSRAGEGGDGCCPMWHMRGPPNRGSLCSALSPGALCPSEPQPSVCRGRKEGRQAAE